MLGYDSFFEISSYLSPVDLANFITTNSNFLEYTKKSGFWQNLFLTRYQLDLEVTTLAKYLEYGRILELDYIKPYWLTEINSNQQIKLYFSPTPVQMIDPLLEKLGLNRTIFEARTREGALLKIALLTKDQLIDIDSTRLIEAEEVKIIDQSIIPSKQQSIKMDPVIVNMIDLEEKSKKKYTYFFQGVIHGDDDLTIKRESLVLARAKTHQGAIFLFLSSDVDVLIDEIHTRRSYNSPDKEIIKSLSYSLYPIEPKPKRDTVVQIF